MLKMFAFIMLSLSFSAYGQNHAQVQQRVTEAFNNRAADDFLIGSSVGYMDQEGQLELNLGAVTSSHQKFEIGSISKTFTGIVLAQLVLENKVQLATPLEEVIPELRGTYAGSVTLKLLANHKARFVRNHPDGDATLEVALINYLKHYTPGPKEPAEGEKRYSNLGFATLGLVISRITEKSYSDAVRERILIPLGMNDSGFLTSLEEHNSLLTPHNVLLQPTIVDVLSDLPSASGGITSSLHDMMKFLALNYQPDAAVQLAQQECLGFDNTPGEVYIWKNGGMTGFSTLMLIDPVNKKASIVLANSNNRSSVDRLALTALGVTDTWEPDLKIPSDFSHAVVGKYFNKKLHYYLDLVTTPNGFLGFILSQKLDGNNTWATRLFTEDRQKFFFLGRGWTSKDHIEFKTNPDSGLKEIMLREFDKADENGNPIYIENIFIPVPAEMLKSKA
jgi:D-alanyl-D-alanine-carboxypeptidase/D-alanyl-D-alanine-endopeptidase